MSLLRLINFRKGDQVRTFYYYSHYTVQRDEILYKGALLFISTCNLPRHIVRTIAVWMFSKCRGYFQNVSNGLFEAIEVKGCLMLNFEAATITNGSKVLIYLTFISFFLHYLQEDFEEQ